MTNAKTTKRAFLTSLVAVVLCFAMLTGTTFAWFTDSVTSENNVIKSGNLDITLEYYNGTDWVDVKGASDILAGDLWEPGYVDVAYLRIKNAGSLALKYQLGVNIVSEKTGLTPTGESITLSDYIYFDVAELTVTDTAPFAPYATREDAMAIATETTLISNGYTKAASLEAGSDYTYLAMVVYMPVSVGNEANHDGTNIPEINLGVEILATQYTKEEDSFDDQYDADAVFGTYIELEAGEDLLAALASAEADKPLTISLLGNVEWPTEGHNGVNDVTPASSVLINGNGYTITATGAGVTPVGDNNAPMTLKNVTVADKSVSYAEDAWEFSYLELGGNLTCQNVSFADPIMVSTTTSSFTACSFLGYEDTVNGIKMNGVWLYNGDASFKNCTFTGTRGMKICDMYSGAEVGTVVIDGCTFTDITQKPGVAIDDCDTQDMKITIKNSSFINCQAGDQGLYIYETDNTLPTVENNIVEYYTELVEIDTKEELFAFAQRVNGGDGMSGVLVKLTADIDLSGEEWIPVGQTGTSYGATNYFQGIFDGQGHTISNMTITNTNDGEYYAAGFFGFVDGAALTVRNVNFDKATVNGHHWTGVVAGYLSGNIDNCHVTNSTVVCTHANDDACGDKAGAIVGYINTGLVNNCSASDTTVSAGRDAGQIVGSSKEAYVANCTATNVNVTVIAHADCTGANIRNEIIGRVL